MLYISSVAQNNIRPPKNDYCTSLVATNVSNAYNYIMWCKDFLDGKHESKKHVLAFYGPPSVGKTRVFCKPILSYMRSNCILGPPGKNPDFYFSPIVGKKAVLLEEFVLGNLQSEQLLTWFGGTSIEVPVKHKNNKKLDPVPILMNGNSKPAFAYDPAFQERINENFIEWEGLKGLLNKELYPLCIWFATKIPVSLYKQIVDYVTFKCSSGIDEDKVYFDNCEWLNSLYSELKEIQ